MDNPIFQVVVMRKPINQVRSNHRLEVPPISKRARFHTSNVYGWLQKQAIARKRYCINATVGLPLYQNRLGKFWCWSMRWALGRKKAMYMAICCCTRSSFFFAHLMSRYPITKKSKAAQCWKPNMVKAKIILEENRIGQTVFKPWKDIKRFVFHFMNRKFFHGKPVF